MEKRKPYIVWQSPKTVQISEENILKAAKDNPNSAELLKSLFPEVFEDEQVFCRIGNAFKRREYPHAVYAVFKWGGEVRILNITLNSFWKPGRNLKVSQLIDSEQETLTVSEFKKLSGKKCLDGITLLDPKKL